MNFCPQCGASLPGGAVSFCPQCGKALPQAEASRSAVKEGASRREKTARRPGRKQTGRGAAAARKPSPAKNSMDENYDGYYDDVPPIDAGWDAGGMDGTLLKRVVLLILGAVCVIVLAVVLMTLL